MKKKNWFTLLLTAALSLSLLTGCGGSSKQSDAASGDNSADAPAASESRLDKVLAAGKITNVCEPYFAPYEFIDNSPVRSSSGAPIWSWPGTSPRSWAWSWRSCRWSGAPC